MNFLTLLEQTGLTLKRVATTNGGEYAGPCPFCGGRDRFRVWPNQDGGRYWCRGCGKHGDAIQYLRETRGLSFIEACTELAIEPNAIRSKKPLEEKPKPPPSLKWQERAESFLTEAVKVLWHNHEALSFLHGRGLQDDAIKAAGLGWNNRTRYEDRESWGLEPEKDEEGKDKKLWLPGGLVIPLIDSISERLRAVTRLRIRRPAGEPRYVIVSGSYTGPMVWDLDKKVLLIVESELDGLLVWQEAGDLVGVVALGTATRKPDEEMDRLLKQAALILVSLDFDEAGGKASWDFWTRTYPSARRWPVPIGKDPSEAFQGGMSVRAWVEAGLTKQTSYLQNQRLSEDIVRPFPKEWLQKFNEEQLERLAIMTIDGRLSDQEAVSILN